MSVRGSATGPLMTPAEAGATLHVAPRTLARWAAEGRLGVVRTPGGHRRYLAVDVQHLAARPPIAVFSGQLNRGTGP